MHPEWLQPLPVLCQNTARLAVLLIKLLVHCCEDLLDAVRQRELYVATRAGASELPAPLQMLLPGLNRI